MAAQSLGKPIGDLARASAVATTIPEAIAVHVDLADEASIIEMIRRTTDHFGRLDVIDNNAALLTPEMAMRDSDIENMDTGD